MSLDKELSLSQLNGQTTTLLRQLAKFFLSALHDSPLGSVPRDGSDIVIKDIMTESGDVGDASSGVLTSTCTTLGPQICRQPGLGLDLVAVRAAATCPAEDLSPKMTVAAKSHYFTTTLIDTGAQM